MINVYSNLMSAWPATMAMSPKLNRNMPTFSQIWDYERITPVDLPLYFQTPVIT